MTATRNQAVDALADKLSRLPGGVLVAGGASRMGSTAALHTIDAKLEAKDHIMVMEPVGLTASSQGVVFYRAQLYRAQPGGSTL